jgi:hypothetical protein
MTVVVFGSIKGAPGVTTTACLTGASWPTGRRVMVVESDRNGGDFAARYGLSAKLGWSSFAAASRRTSATPSVEPHLQLLPGGLPVLVGMGPVDGAQPQWPVDALTKSAAGGADGPWDILVDLGRMTQPCQLAEEWIGRADSTVLLVRGDACTLTHVRDWSDWLHSRCPSRTGSLIVGPTDYGDAEITEFTRLPVLGHLPYDANASGVVSDGRGSPRKLARSSLMKASARLAGLLATESPAIGAEGQPSPESEPAIRRMPNRLKDLLKASPLSTVGPNGAPGQSAGQRDHAGPMGEPAAPAAMDSTEGGGEQGHATHRSSGARPIDSARSAEEIRR